MSLTLVHVVPSSETSSVYELPYAASQDSLISEIVARAPRSSVIVCGSENALAQRVVKSPSMALLAGSPAFSSEIAVATAPRARLVGAASAPESAGTARAAPARVGNER